MNCSGQQTKVFYCHRLLKKPTISRINNTITNGIQRGDVTHHHDQFATIPVPVNFNTKNTMKIIPKRPMPSPELELLFDIILNCFI